jgi:hypothetical protein
MSKLSKQELFELKNQIIMAETINREELQPIMTESLERYMGKHFPKFGYNWDILLNEVYPIVQTNLPAIFFRNPRAYLKPRQKTFIAKVLDPATGKKVDTQLDSQKSANTQEAILNYTLEKIRYKQETRKCLLDALIFPHGIMWHGYKGDWGMTEEQSLYVKDDMPFVERLCPTRFIKDPSVNMSNLHKARWVGRIIDIPYQDFMEDDELKIDKNLIRGFKGFGDKVGTASNIMAASANGTPTGGGDTRPINSFSRNLIDFTDEGYKKSNASNFIRCYEIFLRPTKKQKRDGQKGKILLLTFEQPEPLRENEWTIKAEGFPSKVLQFNELPDCMFGMSDVDTYKSIADNKNVLVNMAIRNAQENSKLYVAIATAGMDGEEDVQKVQSGDQTILLFKGDTVNGKMAVQSGSGAASGELYQAINYTQKNLDDKSGVTDLRRGVLQSGEESALSVKLRAGASSARPAYRQDLMTDFLRESLDYINQINKQFMPFDEAVRIVGSMDLQWSDKPTQEEIQADVDVEIDPISMLPESPEDEAQRLQMVLNLMEGAINNPGIAQKIAQEGMTFNLSPVIEQLLMRLKIKDPDIFRTIKPEESMGYSSNQQLKLAEANVQAAMHGQPVRPPQEGDDHNAQMYVYQSIVQLLAEAGQQQTQAYQQLAQLIQATAAMMQQEQEKQATPGMRMSAQKPFLETT